MNKGLSFGLMVIGVLIGVVGLINHYLLKINAIPHTSTIIFGVAGVVFIVGLIGYFMSAQKAA